MKRFISKLFSGKGVVKEVADVVDRFVDTKEEKREFFNKTLDRVIEDKQHARELYRDENTLHKLYALVFLGSYVSLTLWIIYAIVNGQFATVSQFETGLIGTIWGGMSAKVNTVTDFLFGSSDHNSKDTKTLYEAVTSKDRADRRQARRERRENVEKGENSDSSVSSQ